MLHQNLGQKNLNLHVICVLNAMDTSCTMVEVWNSVWPGGASMQI